MASIGYVQRLDNGGFKGVLKTLTVRADIEIIPNKGKTGEQPDYRVLSNGTELGGGWIRTGEVSGREYIRIAMAAPELEVYTTLPFVRPGGEILLSIEGWPKVEKVLGAIDRVEAAGVDPTRAAPDHWRHVHSRVAAGMDPRSYTAARHRAFELRRDIDQ